MYVLFYFTELNLIAVIKALAGLQLNYQKISSGVWVYVLGAYEVWEERFK